MKRNTIRAKLLWGSLFLLPVLLTGCDYRGIGGGVADIVYGALQLALGIVSVAT
jgi:hypothetical protein